MKGWLIQLLKICNILVIFTLYLTLDVYPIFSLFTMYIFLKGKSQIATLSRKCQIVCKFIVYFHCFAKINVNFYCFSILRPNRLGVETPMFLD